MKITKTHLKQLIKEAISLNEQDPAVAQKKIFVLVGPPSVGKSTWIEKHWPNAYVINRDDIVNQVADGMGWTYDDMYVDPREIPPDKEASKKQGKPYHPKYGFVEPAPSYMSWPNAPKQVYSKVLKANGEIFSKHMANSSAAKDSGLDIVVDMTNMSAGARKVALKAVEGREGEYEKIAVDFKYPSPEIVAAIAEKRNEEEKEEGRSKTIDLKTINRFISQYEPPSKEEGFDKVISVDNIADLKKLVNTDEKPSQASDQKNIKESKAQRSKQMKITKSKLKQIIKEELAEMQMTDIDPDTLSDEDVLRTSTPDDIANDSPEARHLSDQKVVRKLDIMSAERLAEVLAKLDQETLSQALEMYGKTKSPHYEK